jgi:hypothetical protein
VGVSHSNKMAESFGFYRSAMTRLGEKAEAVATLQGAQVGDPPPPLFLSQFLDHNRRFAKTGSGQSQNESI